MNGFQIQSVDHFINICRRRIAEKYDCVIVITGPEGTGKSTFALKYAIEYQGVNGGPEFDFNNQLLYSFIDYLDFIDSAYPIGIFDEAVLVAYCRDWNKPEPKALAKEITRNRYKLKIQIFIIPDLDDLEKKLRKKRAWCWIHIPYRGRAEFHLPRYNKWGMVSPKYQYINWNEVGVLTGYKALDPEIEEEYNAIKEANDDRERQEYRKQFG